MTFENEEIVERIILLNGRISIFKVMNFEGTWQLYGCHPRVLVAPAKRPFSKNYEELEKARAPSANITQEVLSSASDAGELLRKASQSSSTSISSSSKAAIGPVSLQTSIPYDDYSIPHCQLLEEMKRNSLLMDRIRYFYMTILLFQNIMSRFIDVKTTGDVCIESRCMKDSSLAVCFCVD